MLKKTLPLLTILTGTMLSGSIQAETLMQVYQQALQNDPQFQQAQDQYFADRETVNIARAAVLPSLDLGGNLNATSGKTKIDPQSDWQKTPNTVTGYAITVKQPIFDYAAFSGLRGANATVKGSAATYAGAAQSLVVRVTSAYFQVLQSSEDLRYTQAQRRSVYRQLQQSRERFKVGLTPITSVREAQSQYDSILADEIAARNTLANNIESLREITGNSYAQLDGADKVPLISPKPQDIDTWVNAALVQNFDLKASNYAVDVARAGVQVSEAGHYPTVDLQGGYTYSHNSSSLQGGYAKNTSPNATLSVDLPIFSGGSVSAKSRQSAYLLGFAQAQQKQAYRGVVAGTRQAYLGIVAGISKVKADQQAIISSRSALQSTQAAYIVGTRTIVDVLQAQSDLYLAQKQYAQDKFAYLSAMLALKQSAGTLSAEDVSQISNWFDTPVDIGQQVGSVSVAASGNKVAPRRVRATSKSTHKKSSANRKLFTIQLYSSSSKALAERFVKSHKLANKVRVVKNRNNGRVRYVVHLGDFNSYQKAVAASNKLSPALKRNGSWIRPLN